MNDLSNKVALVSGASKGIGAGIAKEMAAAGASVVVNYANDQTGAQSVVAEIERFGGAAVPVRADVSIGADVERLVSETVGRFGRLDVLVNNAAVFEFGPLQDTSDETIHRMLGINLYGLLMICREAIPRLSDGGSIINIGSMSSESYSPGASVNSATKSAMTGITGVLAKELAPRKIRVNQINPGRNRNRGRACDRWDDR